MRGVLVVVASAAACAIAACASPASPKAKAPERPDIRALGWLSDTADPVAFLTVRPAECLSPTTDTALATRRELGRVAFESPALLGGAAARRELSCSACHLNGRGNRNLAIEGVSGAPGTADVTSNIFSKVRGDGVFNPVVIPDLAMRDGRQMADRTTSAFRERVRGLVVEEFDGLEPPAEVFAALLAYLDGLTPEACPVGQPNEPVTLAGDVAAVHLSLAAADASRDRATRLFWIRAARFRLATIHARFFGMALKAERDALENFSRKLETWAAAIRADNAEAAPTQAEWNKLDAALRKAEPRSLYVAANLAAALNR